VLPQGIAVAAPPVDYLGGHGAEPQAPQPARHREFHRGVVVPREATEASD
jgi:hypothetical protein